MDALTLLEERQSIRSFDTSKVIKDADLEKLLKAAVLAPTGRNSQNLYFVLLKDQEKKKRILSSLGIERNFYDAPYVLFTFAKKEDHLDELNVGAALENVYLEATDLGISACWIHSVCPALQSEKGKEVLKEELGLEGEILPFDCMALGYRKGERPARSEKVSHESKIL